MASFTDLHLADASLRERALELGFKKAFAPPLVFLDKQSDLQKIREAKRASASADENGSGLCAVESTNGELLRSAARRGVLVNPLLVRSFGFDDGLVRAVADAAAAGEASAFEIPLINFIRENEMRRAKLMAETRVFLRKCVKLRAPFALVSRAQSVFDVKSPRECVAIGEMLGLSFEQAARALGGIGLV
ncbi:MAG: RNase P subunit p30 family protein [Candidatus Micrarchaeota archaeon]